MAQKLISSMLSDKVVYSDSALAPEVLKRLMFLREVSAVTVMQLSDCAGLPWADQAGVVFGGTNLRIRP